MEKITIPDYGTVSSDWLSQTLNRLSSLQKLHRDLHSRFVYISEILDGDEAISEEDSVYMNVFAEGVRAEFKKVDDLIFREIYAELAMITNGKGAELTKSESLPCSIERLREETEKFKNLEETYKAARKMICEEKKPLAYPQVRWLVDSFDRDFEREKSIFADKMSHLIQNR